MSEVTLNGLLGHNPLGFLAALGALSLATDVHGEDVTLRWQEAGPAWVGILGGDGIRDEDSVVDALLEACSARDVDGELGWSKDVRLGSRDEVRHAIGAASPGRSLEMVAACTAELPLSRNDRPPYTPFRLIPVVGRAQLLETAKRESDAPRASDLRAALFDRWRYKRGVNSLRLDPGARLQARALMAEAPDKAGTNGVPGSVLLGLRGLAFFPLHPAARRLRSAGWNRGDQFIWPIWDTPLTERVVRVLLGVPWLEDPNTDASLCLRAHHVVARYRAPRQRLGSDGAILGWGEPIG